VSSICEQQDMMGRRSGAKPGSEDRGGRLSLKTTKPARTQYKNGKRTDHNVYIDIKSS
jgi:hypothetical protein